MSVINSRTFNQSPSTVKAMAQDGPVFVTDRGRPSLVVLAIGDYERLVGSDSVRDSLRMDTQLSPDVEVEFTPQILRDLGRVPPL